MVTEETACAKTAWIAEAETNETEWKEMSTGARTTREGKIATDWFGFNTARAAAHGQRTIESRYIVRHLT